jgi:hypothetical protein
MVATAVTCAAMIITARVVGRLWQECFELRIATWLHRIFVISVVIGTVASIVRAGLYWYAWYAPLMRGVLDWQGVGQLMLTLPVVWEVASIISGGCMIVFSVMAWQVTRHEGGRFAQALLVMSALVGAAMISTAVVDAAQLDFNRYYLRFVVPAITILGVMILAMLFSTFRIMSLSGRTLRRIEQ